MALDLLLKIAVSLLLFCFVFDCHSLPNGTIAATNESISLRQKVLDDIGPWDDESSDVLLRMELEQLKHFLSQNIRLPEQINSNSPLSRKKRLFSYWPPVNRPVINETLHVLTNLLTDIGFQTVGISRNCREKSICNTSNFIINRMPQFVMEYGREKLNRLPSSAFGSNEFTDAWVVGLASPENYCDELYSCDGTQKTDTSLDPNKDRFTFMVKIVNNTEPVQSV